MTISSWILNESLRVLDSKDHPYLETALATLGAHELALSYSKAREAKEGHPEFKVFLDGEQIFEMGDASPTKAWFTLCRALGYSPEANWDWDPALILFQQVIPAMTGDWHEHELPYTGLGVPEGVICLANLRHALAERVATFRHRVGDGHGDPALTKVVELFEWLPLRSVIFHDDPRRRVDFVGNDLDSPFLGIFLHLGLQRETAVFVSRATLHSTGGLKWSPWLPGGDWGHDGRQWVMTQGPEDFIRASGLPPSTPQGFEEAFQRTLRQLFESLEPLVEAYRETHPESIPWHRDPKTRYLNRMIVAVRFEGRPILTLDDGSEITVMEHEEAQLQVGADRAGEVWGA